VERLVRGRQDGGRRGHAQLQRVPLSGRTAPLLGSFVFFWIAPATVAGWVPWWLTGWSKQSPPFAAAAAWAGWLLVALGTVVVVESFVRFAIKGLGTPAPVAPTRQLVVSGLYRHVRNPMYVGVTSAIVGQALILGRSLLLQYAACVWLAFHLFVLLYEEPTLQRTYGMSYQTYKANVRRWWPRLAPWRR
jgi:protein-S-isoprenylcysteine O-methyltransferase Ste14